MEKSSLPSELKAELRTNIANMQNALVSGFEEEDPIVLTDTAERVHAHLNKIIRSLRERNWLNQEPALGYQLEEVSNSLEKFLYRGILGESSSARGG